MASDEIPTLTEDAYWAMVETATEEVMDKIDDDLRAHVESGSKTRPDSLSPERLQTLRTKAAEFHDAHPYSLGLYEADAAYLGQIIQHSPSEGWSGYFDFAREQDDNRPEGPVNAREAIRYAALFCMQRDIQDGMQERYVPERMDELREELDAEANR